ncbi:hypothetical protein [Streptomyces griseomycini]|uniref:hypothetical protein n=1 Tax=Streptomyces griseomycini TaxID=66895 RepID=UPI001877256E|nr:hypothetical protein [Streptomyces griseomycini]
MSNERIVKVELYRPVPGEADACPRLAPAPARPIRWDLVAQQRDAPPRQEPRRGVAAQGLSLRPS